MISQSSINEVMGRADIVDVIGQFVRLRRRGTNYIANCPFHNEKTPSFNVSGTKGIYKCFGCGKAGNVVSFIQEHEKLNYPEAIHWLADYYKIQIEETERSPEQQQQQQAGEALRVLNEFAAKYFNNVLLNTEEGKLIGMSYFRQRGFRADTIEKFRLGYNPEHNEEFYQAAIKNGYNKDLVEKAGLIKNRNGIYHDVYRGRVIFPIQGMTGRILGFGARILKSTEKAPKYINTPENELYIKSKILYGMYQARQAIGKNDECFLVEGYTDVISLHQGGVENVVSSSGTSLTEDQLRLMGQLTKNLTILYDGDSAGIKAALRGLDMAVAQSFNVQLVLLPDGEDPDSYIQKHGAAHFHEYVKGHKQDVINFRIGVGLADVGNDPVKKSKLVNEIAESIAKINKAEDFSLQSFYIREAVRRLDVDETGMVNLVNKYLHDKIEQENRPKRKEEVMPAPEHLSSTPEPAPHHQQKPDDGYEWQMLKMLIEYGHQPYDETMNVARLIEERVDPDLLNNKLVIRLFIEYFKHFLQTGGLPEAHFFINNVDAEVRQVMASLLQPAQEVNPKWKERYGIESVAGPMQYVNDVDSTLSYYELRKVFALLDEMEHLLKTEKDPAILANIQKRFLELRQVEREILKKHRTVVFEALKYKKPFGKDIST